jgi:inosine-uridine nucleoside N-ribohydrolase
MRTARKELAAGLLATISVLQLYHADVQAGGTASPDKEGMSTPNVIFDTDVWSNIDDALALAMLHALHDRRELNLVAVAISTDNKWGASYVDLINTFYGHPQIPIGILHDGIRTAAFQEKFFEPKRPVSRYTQLIAERYPHRLTDGARASEAVSVLRKTLAAQPDRSVVIVQVGFSTNLARLMDSQADAASALNGRDLIRKKVRLLSVMAGNFRETTPETNVRIDVPSAQKVFSDWPTPLVASGFEIGLGVRYPGQSIEHDYSYVEHHPIAETYQTYCREQKANGLIKTKCPHDHPTFDLTSVLYAARPDRGYFSISKPGKITVLADGSTRFDEFAEGLQQYLILSEEQKARTLEAMVMLASQPPKR